MKVEIRKMKPDDWNQVSKIYDEGTDSGNANFEVTIPPWDEWIQKQVPGCSIVAIKSGDIRGWGSLAVYSEREVYSGVVEDSVYITKEYRRKGVGDILLEKLIELSEEKSIWTLQARIFPENGESIALHRKHAFRTVGTHERLGKMDEQWRDVTVMERRSKKIGL
ncbi:MAG: N-acetyltransferase family protein [Methanobacterium sp.]